MTAETDRIHYLQGRYDMCSLLLTSPRFNSAQRDVITEQAYKVKTELESLGIRFIEEAA